MISASAVWSHDAEKTGLLSPPANAGKPASTPTQNRQSNERPHVFRIPHCLLVRRAVTAALTRMLLGVYSRSRETCTGSRFAVARANGRTLLTVGGRQGPLISPLSCLYLCLWSAGRPSSSRVSSAPNRPPFSAEFRFGSGSRPPEETRIPARHHVAVGCSRSSRVTRLLTPHSGAGVSVVYSSRAFIVPCLETRMFASSGPIGPAGQWFRGRFRGTGLARPHTGQSG